MDDLITRAQAAALLNLSVARVRQLGASGDLTELRNSIGRVRFRRAEVIALKRHRDTFCAERVPA